jgi:4-hydroxybenzoate polyprenyltransferase
MIRFSHTIFALPFALASAVSAARFAPLDWTRLGWIVVAMVGARTAAMGFNRLVDRDIDARNPRTRDRELPRGVIGPGATVVFIVLAAATLMVAAWQLGPLPLKLTPLALFIIFFYSLTKRFTWASQLFLGLALAGAPLGAWIAVTGEIDRPALALGLGVLTWVAGFDTIYACQDIDFDRAEGLHSLPARFGITRALIIARLMHVVTVAALVMFGLLMDYGTMYAIGVMVVAGTLIYEHRLVHPHDLSRVGKAFFDLNGLVSIIFLLAVLASRPWITP